MVTRFTFCSVLFLCFFFCGAQLSGAGISGVIRADSGEPVHGATVALPELDRHVHTDEAGIFLLDDIQEGKYIITAIHLGFEIYKEEILVKENILNITINLKKSAIELSEVKISNSKLDMITQLDMKLRPMHSAQDILRIIPGLVTAQHAGGGKAEQIFLRGIDIDHGTDIELNADGMPVNMVSHAHGQGYADLHFLIPELVQHVDFQKGPYYPDHGDFNTAGYADFKTKNILEHNEIKFEAGQHNTYRLLGMMNIINQRDNYGGRALYIAGDYHTSNGYFEKDQDFNRMNAMAKYSLYNNNGNSFNVSASVFKSGWKASGQIPGRAVTNGLITRFGSIDEENGNTSRQNLIVTHVGKLSEKASLKNIIYYSHYDFELFSNFTFFLQDSVNGDRIVQREDRHMTGYKGIYSYIHNWGKQVLVTTVGISSRTDFINGSELSHVTMQDQLINGLWKGDIVQQNASLFINEEIELNKSLSVSAGLRYDYIHYKLAQDEISNHSDGDGILNPKLNIRYSPSEKLQLFIKGGSGFHSHDARLTGRGHSADLTRAGGIDAGLVASISGKLVAGVTAWFLDMENELVYVGDESVVESAGKTVRKGIDLLFRYQLNKYLYINSDVNICRPRLRNAEAGKDYIPLAPSFSGTAGITCQVQDRFYASLCSRFTGDRAANEENSVTAEGHFIFDTVFRYETGRVTFSIMMQNVFNSEWNEAQFDTESRLRDELTSVSEIHFTPGSPRWIRAGTAFRF
jgi:outer membrane receptor protein involved in Fe transport